jgi:hypothetical protein
MDGPASAPRVSRWGAVVMVSALLVVGGAVALAIASVATSHERKVSFAVRGALSGVTLDLGDADVTIAGGGQRTLLGVQRTDRYAFGHDADVTRTVDGGELHIRSRCPQTVPRACSVQYRLVVPDNVPVAVRTQDGTVSFNGYRGSARVTTRSGDIDVDSFCGFSLQATAKQGDVDAGIACSPDRLELRSDSGDVRAVVPQARYRVDADSNAGRVAVSGIVEAADAPWSIQALSGSGDVTVRGER